MPQSPADELLTPEQVADEFKLKTGTQASMRSRGQIPFVRLGGGRKGGRIIRYRRSELVAWVASKAVAPRSV